MREIPQPDARPREPADTIAAIATAPGVAGIAIVRVSGPRSLEIADRIFHGSGAPPSARPAGTFLHGFARMPNANRDGGDEADLDEVILLIYRAPHSYTREDVVEIQGHGGGACAQRLLRAVLAAGATAAEPGEFTKRAFLNGRIDLLQAEAVMDLVQARSARAVAAAVDQLEGSLSSCIATSYDAAISTASSIEASLDFSDQELPVTETERMEQSIAGICEDLDRLLSTWHEGRLLREGALVVICGRPNVGKSTLLNRLVGRDRAIVAEYPGTTRDTIEEDVVLAGIPMKLVDTAGIRISGCSIEKEGVERARSAIARADALIFVVDASKPFSEEDAGILNALDVSRCIVLLNKIDLGRTVDPLAVHGAKTLETCLLHEEDTESVRRAIIGMLDADESGPQHAVIAERHRQAIERSLCAFRSALGILESGQEDQVVFAANEMRTGIEELGRLIGKTYSDDLLDSIFGKFCVGK